MRHGRRGGRHRCGSRRERPSRPPSDDRGETGHGPRPSIFDGIEKRTCFHHVDRETGRSCTRCGRPACHECLTDAPVGAHCWECIKAARPPTKERLRRWNATAGPLVTKVIIGINLVVFLLTLDGQTRWSRELQDDLVAIGPLVAGGEWWRLVTSGFVHFGVLHLAFNMVVLYRFGEMLERPLGRARFIGLYACSLLGGSLGVMLLSPVSYTGGASGAVFGLVGAAAVGVRSAGHSVWQSGIGVMLVANLVITFAVPNISIGGHLGGLAFGAACGWFMFRAPQTRRSTLEGVALSVALSLAAAAGAVAAATALSPQALLP